ncbi:hypothetical protein BD324DRAFT_609353 [Kockovaella imperatae]|uniref:RRM domain-containing protein n=1 Tax=Kockovaella imperatae TaxID=4999 RepID=A0A1Y1UC06_9TREE|nr:hypothetical protein BD324DRAFT_609353 [Kockovaella imperatae]ORX35573.1 hypothetical protein BD324DRAFT_609353 [Kockovaella imperatae]
MIDPMAMDIDLSLQELIHRDQHHPGSSRHQRTRYTGRASHVPNSQSLRQPASGHPYRTFRRPPTAPRAMIHSPTVFFRPFPSDASFNEARELFESTIGPIQSLVRYADGVRVTFKDVQSASRAIAMFDRRFWRDTDIWIRVERCGVGLTLRSSRTTSQSSEKARRID